MSPSSVAASTPVGAEPAPPPQPLVATIPALKRAIQQTDSHLKRIFFTLLFLTLENLIRHGDFGHYVIIKNRPV